jgi:sporulation protein YlmC with PRC-barrel domain
MRAVPYGCFRSASPRGRARRFVPRYGGVLRSPPPGATSTPLLRSLYEPSGDWFSNLQAEEIPMQERISSERRKSSLGAYVWSFACMAGLTASALHPLPAAAQSTTPPPANQAQPAPPPAQTPPPSAQPSAGGSSAGATSPGSTTQPGIRAVDPATVRLTFYAVRPVDMLMSNFMDTDVYNLQNEEIGEVEDVIIDEGRTIRAIVISVGGFLGIGDRNVAVEPGSVVITRGEGGSIRAVVNATRENLEKAPEFKFEGNMRR